MRLSILWLILILILTLLAPHLSPYDPIKSYGEHIMQAPNRQFLLGTDLLGRDVLSRVLYGGQRTLAIALIATITATIPAGIIGISTTLLGQKINTLTMIIINSLLSIPQLVIAMVIITLFGQGAIQLAIATGIAQIAFYTQVIRSAALNIQTQSYIEGANAIGATKPHIMRYYIYPNIRSTALAYGGVVLSYSILNSAALSFLGLGGDPGVPDWGIILAEGRLAFQTAPWVSIAPGIIIALTIAAINTIVDHIG